MGFPPPHDAAAPFLAFLRRSLLASWLPWAWGFGVGVVFAGLVLGWDFVTGDPLVVRQVAGDNAAGLAAFRAFVDDGWHWPLLAAPSFGDSGVNVAFSDSIPLLAVVAKLARPFGIDAETWWGGWFAFAYGLQGAGAVFAVRSWGARALLPQLAAPVLAVSMPVLLLQTVHPSLSAHGVLLVAWGFAGRLRRPTATDGSSPGWLVGLTLIALAIHPYLGVMVAAVAAGVVGDGLVAGRLRFGDVVGWSIASVVVVGSWLQVGGYLGAAGASEGGYGQYATSVLGPIVPTLSSILDTEPTSFEIEPSHPGYAYLGLGVAGLASAAVVLHRRRLRWLVRHNQLLAVTIAAMACWAVTPWVRLTTGDRFDIPAALAVRLGSPRRAGIALSILGVVISAALLAWLLRPAVPNRSRSGRLDVGVDRAGSGPFPMPAPVPADDRSASTRTGGSGASEPARSSGRTGWGGVHVRRNEPVSWSGASGFRPALSAMAVLVLGLSLLGLVAAPAVGAAMSQFRASGRFAWPLLYGLLTFAVVATDPDQLGRVLPTGPPAQATGRRTSSAWSPAVLSVGILAISIAVQVADTATLRRFAHELLVPGGSDRQDYVAVLVDLVEAHDRVVLGPDFRCTYYPDGVGAFIDVTGAASAAERPIDRVYSARRPQTEPCSVPQTVDLSDPGALIVLVEPVAVRTGANRGKQIDERCRQHATLNVCSHHWDDVAPDVLGYFGPIDD